MANLIEIVKGVHPGKIIERDLKKRHITQRALATAIGIRYQTLDAIISGTRNITLEVSLNIEKALGYEEGFLLILQDYYQIAVFKKKQSKKKYTHSPNVRKSLFWDTDFNKIDWEKYRKAVINRVWERGNQEEKEDIARFYNLNPAEIKNYISIAKSPIPDKHNKTI
ncbi:MAG: HigA family addiction module antidote protein [Tannerellaceae bacterium]|jgi:addiction module HigA family antidote|nr:HigA family addiction module antidote protein [Tannerellaceae bacterium]